MMSMSTRFFDEPISRSTTRYWSGVCATDGHFALTICVSFENGGGGESCGKNEAISDLLHEAISDWGVRHVTNVSSIFVDGGDPRSIGR